MTENSPANSPEAVQPDLFEEKECDELPEIEIIDEQACIHDKSVQDYCPHCTEDKFGEVFRNWQDELEDGCHHDTIDGRDEK
jgi:hypothetical protein